MFKASPTFQDKFLAAGQRSSGFDYLRIFLALSIMLWHTDEINYGDHAKDLIWQSPWRMLLGPLVPSFFALSGFLVAGSLERNTLFKFIGLRVFRILPVLFCDTVLCALVLGPIFTNLPLADYFACREFFAYFLNIFGDIHFILPAVFTHNPNVSTVNAQLWTIPYELECYIALSVMAAIGVFRRRAFLLACVIGIYLFQAVYLALCPEARVAGTIDGHSLVMIFITGVTFYRYRDKIPYNGWLFTASLMASALLYEIDGGDRLVAIFTTYATLYPGLMNPPRHKIVLSGDYSYGIYIYAYPIQQMIASLSPQHRVWWFSILFSLPLTILAGVLSWWLVEKPVLNRRAILKTWESDITGFFRHIKSKNPLPRIRIGA